MDADTRPVALITGGSAGLGFVIAEKLVASDYRIMIVGRDEARLNDARQRLSESAVSPGKPAAEVHSQRCDLASSADVAELFQQLQQRCGRLDVLINCVGTSDRGLIENLAAERLELLFRQNVLTALLCSQAAIPMLEASAGSIVNIGSLASKVGARYVGGYATAKHALAGMTQQMRLELRTRGIHVGLVNPGPIARPDAGRRYQESMDSSLPKTASRPGAGARVRGLSPERVADAVLHCIRHRKADMVMPGYLRILIAVGHAMPGVGDWLLLKFTSAKENP